MDTPILIDKPLGATPLQTLDLLRVARPVLREARLSYAGRLDPMASGLLTVVSGTQLQRQEEYWVLPKVYDVTVLMGWITDSYDLLGLARSCTGLLPSSAAVHMAVAGIVGRHRLPLPAYSSFRVEGEPLFARTRRGVTGGVPQREMIVHQADVLGDSTLDADALRFLVRDGVGRVRGDFRQKEIFERWDAVLPTTGHWPAVHIRIACAGGTYVRALAHELGARLGSGACVASLRRIAVGEWRVTDPTVLKLSWPQ